MSAPIIAVELGDAIGPLLETIARALGAETIQFNWSTAPGMSPWFGVYLHAEKQCFTGTGGTIGEAIMAANGKRQTFLENMEKAA